MIRGDPVTINLTTTDATTPLPVILKDSTGKTRTLLATESLIVTSLQANVSVLAVGADVYATADDTSTGDVIVGSFATNADGMSFMAVLADTGIGCPKGATPKVVASHSGAITLVGTGYIQVDSTQVGRQSWQCSLNPA